MSAPLTREERLAVAREIAEHNEFAAWWVAWIDELRAALAKAEAEHKLLRDAVNGCADDADGVPDVAARLVELQAERDEARKRCEELMRFVQARDKALLDATDALARLRHVVRAAVVVADWTLNPRPMTLGAGPGALHVDAVRDMDLSDRAWALGDEEDAR
jgi:hypothetical protein